MNRQNMYERDLRRLMHIDERTLYALSNLVTHLYNDENYERLYQVLVGNPAWMEAKARQLSGDSSYRAELDLAIGTFTNSLTPNQHLALLSLYTARQVVQQRVITLNDHCIEALGWLGQIDEARDAIKLRSDPLEKLKGLLTLYSFADKHTPLEDELFKEMLILLTDIKIQHEHALALREFALALRGKHDELSIEYFEQAITATYAIRDDMRRPSGLETLCLVFARLQLFDKTKQVEALITQAEETSGSYRSRILSTLASALVDAGQLHDAQVVLNTIPDIQRRIRVVSSLARSSKHLSVAERTNLYAKARRLNRSLDRSRRIDLRDTLALIYAYKHHYTKALALTAKIKDPVTKATAYLEIADLMAQDDPSSLNQVNSEIWTAIEDITDLDTRLRLLTILAARMKQYSDKHTEAIFEQIVTVITANSTRNWSSGEAYKCVQVLCQNGHFGEATRIAHAIVNKQDRFTALSILAASLAHEGNPSARAMLEKARSTAFAIHNDIISISLLTSLATLMAKTAHEHASVVFEHVNSLIDALNNTPDKRIEALTHFAVAQAGAGDQEESLFLQLENEIQNNITNLDPRTLVIYAKGLTQAGRIDQAEAFATSLTSDSAQADAFIQIGLVLIQQGDEYATNVLAKAKAIAPKIQNIYEIPATLSALVRVLASIGDPDVEIMLDYLAEVVNAMETDWDWAQAATALAEALIWCGYREEAEQAINDLPINEMQGSVVLCSVEAWATEYQFDKAIVEATAIQDDQYREEALKIIAAYLARDGQFQRALETHRPRILYTFMEGVTNWMTHSAILPPTLALDSLAECIRLAAWVNPFWKEIDALLQPSTHSRDPI